jgi:hypothetical protein
MPRCGPVGRGRSQPQGLPGHFRLGREICYIFDNNDLGGYGFPYPICESLRRCHYQSFTLRNNEPRQPNWLGFLHFRAQRQNLHDGYTSIFHKRRAESEQTRHGPRPRRYSKFNDFEAVRNTRGELVGRTEGMSCSQYNRRFEVHEYIPTYTRLTTRYQHSNNK